MSTKPAKQGTTPSTELPWSLSSHCSPPSKTPGSLGPPCKSPIHDVPSSETPSSWLVSGRVLAPPKAYASGTVKGFTLALDSSVQRVWQISSSICYFAPKKGVRSLTGSPWWSRSPSLSSGRILLNMFDEVLGCESFMKFKRLTTTFRTRFSQRVISPRYYLDF
jgi:hypothetical protein